VPLKDPILPPGVHRLLRTFLRNDLLDEVTGDLHEMYKDTRRSHSPFTSNIIAWYQVINYLRPFAIRKRSQQHSANPLPMYKSYFITAIRNMIKNKMHASLNILGLSVGITITIVIMLWMTDELSHEKSFTNYEHIGRVIQNVTNNGEVQTWTSIPWPLSDELRKNYGSDFKYIAITDGGGRHRLTVGDIKFDKSGYFAEPELAKMLDLEMIYGTTEAANDPKSILLSKSTSKAYFGDNDPIGQIMTIEDNVTLKVGGVYKDIPANSNFANMQMLLSWQLFYEEVDWLRNMDDPWRPNAFSLYVQLNDNVTFETASAHIKDAKMKRISPALQKKKPQLFIHPMSEWYLKADFENGKQTTGRMQYVWLFGIVGAFVLLMACINFMNLSTARSEKRAKEVGIRKAIGSLQSQLVNQFLSESIITVFLSLLVALVLTQVTLPFFNLISQKNMSMPWSNLTWWVSGIAFTFVVGAVAGSYPALYLSSMGLQQVKAARSSSVLRKVLVTTQFAVSVVLMIGTTVVYLQIQYAKNRPLGYNSNGLISIWNSDGLHSHADAIRNELKANGSIIEMAESSAPPTSTSSSSSQFDWNGKDPNLSVDFSFFRLSHEYGKTVGWNVLTGRDFDDRPSDTIAMIINKSAADYIGMKEAGGVIRWTGQPFEVIGIIENMVVTSPYADAVPMIYVCTKDIENAVIFRLNPEKPATESLSLIEPVIQKHNSDGGFAFDFVDDVYERKFGNEERVGTLATTLACLAIFISCLGIFGLSSFTGEQRTKEIGVRKVLGASTYELWRLMSKDFVFLTVLSCAIAIPIAYLLLTDWLENFYYHMGIPMWTFVAATGLTLMITLLTVSWHTLSAAGTNPVKSLKVE
jgi:putative ABC transport system permease protein